MKNSILKIEDFQILSKKELQKNVGGGFNHCVQWFCCEPNGDGTCAIWSYNCNFYFTYCP